VKDAGHAIHKWEVKRKDAQNANLNAKKQSARQQSAKKPEGKEKDKFKMNI
tara:strand:- start:166 stop:318 length:153 start_codon:yes stop_codon:yes gene_type:complete